MQDKHRDLLLVSFDVPTVQLGGFYEYEDALVAAVPTIDMRPDVKFQDGAVLGTLDAGATVRAADQLIVRPAVKMQLEYRDTIYDVIPTLDRLVTDTRRYLDVLLSGLEETNEQPAPD
ncbi:hypothetical protein ACIPEP_08410 [Curtobacterium sp. NPDC087082]|uniref:hypothetical protein n=1 Tax=Curtobacterium sp. NPDC087082 TaxID=3363966 RepID=UPI00380BA2FB